MSLTPVRPLVTVTRDGITTTRPMTDSEWANYLAVSDDDWDYEPSLDEPSPHELLVADDYEVWGTWTDTLYDAEDVA